MTNDDSDDEHDHPRWFPIPHPPPPCYLTPTTIALFCTLNDTLLNSLAFMCMFRFIAGKKYLSRLLMVGETHDDPRSPSKPPQSALLGPN